MKNRVFISETTEKSGKNSVPIGQETAKEVDVHLLSNDPIVRSHQKHVEKFELDHPELINYLDSLDRKLAHLKARGIRIYPLPK